MRIELTTCCLRNSCSTTELHRRRRGIVAEHLCKGHFAPGHYPLGMDHHLRTARFDGIHAAVAVPVLRYLARRAQPDVVEDLHVEVLVTLWRRIDAVPEGGEIPWAIGVARRVLANHRRANGRAARLLAKLALLTPGVDPGPEPNGGDAELDAALGRLRADDREILRLFAWEQLTTGEIAQVLEISANAAGVRLHRAKARLRDELRTYDKERSKNRLVARQEESAERKEARDER